ncbi:tetratricopeptide repeat protein [Mongoliitalea daihaiensis]|uniref:tetratricopeptide repeat protein n=1 Tax=Mongoliitalea daihaiensis TaxID=2782006 RepID=UPI001F18259A|nr:tetratricopeptide repeat protein [Mongoliitalea daihaiensis]UJP64285.1 tetratricopeptide repeat protein [Mongoliitalea daihaiensis]
MKFSVLFLLTVILCTKGFSQSGLYQRSSTKLFDDSFELMDKHLFSAAGYSFKELSSDGTPGEIQLHGNFNQAIAALKIEQPNASDGVYIFIRKNPNHPLANDAAHILGDFFFDKRNYREAIPAYNKVNVSKVSYEQGSEVLFKKAYAYFQLRDYQNALLNFNAVKSHNSSYSPDAFYYAGFIALEQKKYDQAIRDLKEADKSNFYANKVPALLSAIFYRQGYFDELIAYAEPALQNRSNLESRELIHLYLAEAYFEKKSFDKAAANYDAFVNAQKSDLNRTQVYRAGISQYEIRNYQRATDYLKISAVGDDQLAQISSYYLGHAYIKLNNPQFASNSFSAAYKSNADIQVKEDALVNFAKVNLERGNFQEAVNALDNYLDTFPNGTYRSEAEGLLTDALINTSNYLRAIDQLEKMSKKSDRLRGAYQKITFYQGIVYYRDRRHDLANTLFDKSLKEPIDKGLVMETHFWKGENFAAQEKLPEAIRAYEQVLAQRPDSRNPITAKTHYGLGYSLFNTQQYEKSENHFRSYVNLLQGSIDPQNYDEALIRLGDVYYVQKKFVDAQTIFQRAIREQNDFIDYAYFRSGVVFNFQNRNNEAIVELTTLINNFSNSLYLEDAIYQKSQILMEMTNYAEASDGFTRLIGTRPSSPFIPFALEGRAIANFSMQNFNATIEDYKRILDNHPNASNAEAALVGLQETLAMQNRSGEFSQYLSKYRSANPDNKSVQSLEYEAAKNLYFSNDSEQAITAFNMYLRNYPQSSNKPEALFFIGDAQMKLGRKNDALETFYRLEKEQASPQRIRAIQRIASLEMENGQVEKALPFYRESLSNARNQVEEYESLKGMMEAYYLLNRMDETLEVADRIINLGAVVPDAIPQALLLKAKALLKTNKKGQAEGVFENLVKEYKTIHGAEGLFLWAEGKSKDGQHAASNELIFDYSNAFSSYDYWFGRSFILIAENYQKLGEAFQAKATLQSIIENAVNEEVKRMARERLNQLN